MKITDSEWKIMVRLWETPKTITQLTKELKDDTGWSKNTIITMLKRMEEKGMVYYIEADKAKMFYANCNKEEVAIDEAEAFLDKVFEGNVPMLLSAFVKNRSLKDEDIEEICNILNLKKKD